MFFFFNFFTIFLLSCIPIATLWNLLNFDFWECRTESESHAAYNTNNWQHTQQQNKIKKNTNRNSTPNPNSNTCDPPKKSFLNIFPTCTTHVPHIWFCILLSHCCCCCCGCSCCAFCIPLSFRVCPVSVSVKESPPNPEEVKRKTTQIPINRKCCVHLPDKHIQIYIYIIHVNIYCIYTQS